MFRINGTDNYECPLLLIFPITGPARDVFASAFAFVVVIDVSQKLEFAPKTLRVMSALLRLTPREASIAGAVASGHSLSGAARNLNIGIGTAQNHLKNAMQKAGVHSQVELAALITKLSGLIDL